MEIDWLSAVDNDHVGGGYAMSVQNDIGTIMRAAGITPTNVDQIAEIDDRKLQTNQSSASISIPAAADYGLLECDKSVAVVLLEGDDELIFISRIKI